MSGTPSLAEIYTQLRAVVDLLESTRDFADGTVADGGGLLDVLIQAIEGEYTPALADQALAYRAGFSSLVDPRRAQDLLGPVMFEWARLISGSPGSATGFGAGRTSLDEAMVLIYDYCRANAQTVESRAITYDTTATTSDGKGGSIVGSGAISRLTVDENGYALEACTVEKKVWQCISDQNSGRNVHRELWEMVGQAASRDALLRPSFGSGEDALTRVTSAHAGTGDGGSLLRNASFSDFDATTKFDAWTITYGGAAVAADVTQDTTNYFRSHPNASTDASLKIAMDSAADTVTLKQLVTQFQRSQLDPTTPYFLRVMLNKTVGSAAGGAITIRIGSQTEAIFLSSLGSGWQELRIGTSDPTDCWFRNFNESGCDVEIEWASGTAGYMLFDDIILVPWTLIDGTYWNLRGGATAWQVGDTLELTDTGGAPATAKIQYWMWVAGLGYLPSTTGTPTITEP